MAEQNEKQKLKSKDKVLLQREATDFLRELQGSDSRLGPAAQRLREGLLQKVARQLNPSSLEVGAWLLGVHLVASAISLSICEQFGLRFLGQGHGLMALFMHLGMVGCFVACGAFYLSGTILMSWLVLSRPQWRRIHQHYGAYFLGLALASLVLFLVLQGQVDLILATAWLIGATGSAYLIRFALAGDKGLGLKTH